MCVWKIRCNCPVSQGSWLSLQAWRTGGGWTGGMSERTRDNPSRSFEKSLTSWHSLKSKNTISGWFLFGCRLLHICQPKAKNKSNGLSLAIPLPPVWPPPVPHACKIAGCPGYCGCPTDGAIFCISCHPIPIVMASCSVAFLRVIGVRIRNYAHFDSAKQIVKPFHSHEKSRNFVLSG